MLLVALETTYGYVFTTTSDSEILQSCSTSPSAAGPDFVENERRQWAYLVQHPDWRERPSQRNSQEILEGLLMENGKGPLTDFFYMLKKRLFGGNQCTSWWFHY